MRKIPIFLFFFTVEKNRKIVLWFREWATVFTAVVPVKNVITRYKGEY